MEVKIPRDNVTELSEPRTSTKPKQLGKEGVESQGRGDNVWVESLSFLVLQAWWLETSLAILSLNPRVLLPAHPTGVWSTEALQCLFSPLTVRACTFLFYQRHFFSQIRALSALALFPRSTPYIKPEFFYKKSFPYLWLQKLEGWCILYDIHIWAKLLRDKTDILASYLGKN